MCSCQGSTGVRSASPRRTPRHAVAAQRRGRGRRGGEEGLSERSHGQPPGVARVGRRARAGRVACRCSPGQCKRVASGTNTPPCQAESVAPTKQHNTTGTPPSDEREKREKSSLLGLARLFGGLCVPSVFCVDAARDAKHPGGNPSFPPSLSPALAPRNLPTFLRANNQRQPAAGLRRGRARARGRTAGARPTSKPTLRPWSRARARGRACVRHA